VGGGIGPLGLVDPWIGYRVFKKKRSTSSTTMDGGVAERSGLEWKPHSSFTVNSEKGNAKTCTGKFETIQKLSSETQLDTMPRKRTREPSSLVNPEEGYDPSWIYKDSGTEKSSRSKKDCDNGYVLTPSYNPTSIKVKNQSNSKTVSEALVSKVKNGKIEKHAQSIKTRDKGSDLQSTESPASTKGIKPQTLGDMSKAQKVFFFLLKNGEIHY